MATTTYEAETLVLMNETKITVRPLKISLLRKFMKKFDEVATVGDDNEKAMDLLIDCVQIALEQYDSELAKDRKNLEEILDLPTVYKIVEAASGSSAANIF